MPTVYLPYGWPLLQGETYQAVVYQGRVARRYAVPADPRTDQQMQNRYLFADMRRVLTTMGPWARGAVKAMLGVRWMSNFYTLVKADDGEAWKDAMMEWNGWSQSLQDAWNSAAPYQATWNEPGKMWFGCLLVMQWMFEFLGTERWGMPVVWSGSMNDLLTWWGSGVESAMTDSLFDDLDAHISVSGVWVTQPAAEAYNGSWRWGRANGKDSAQFYFVGRAALVGFTMHTGQGLVKIELDGVEVAQVPQWSGHLIYKMDWFSDLLPSGLHSLRLTGNVESFPTLDYVRIFGTVNFQRSYTGSILKGPTFYTWWVMQSQADAFVVNRAGVQLRARESPTW